MIDPAKTLAKRRIDIEITGEILPIKFIGRNKNIGSNKPLTQFLTPLYLILFTSTIVIVIIAKVKVTEKFPVGTAWLPNNPDIEDKKI